MTTKTSDWRPGPAVCRCCFAEGCYKDISTEYFWMGKREVYSEMLTETFDVHIGYSQTGGPNSNSRLICEPCISRLRDASDFKRQVQECEKVFLQHLAQPASSADYEVEVEVPKDEVKLERVKLENKMEDDDDDFDDHIAFPDDDDDDDDLDDEPLMKLASKVPKKESVELLNLLTEDKPQTALKRKSTLKLKPSPPKKPKKKEAPQPSVSKPVKMEKKKKDPAPDDVARRNALLLLKHSTVYPFQPSRKSFRCCFCPYGTPEFKDPTAFREHMHSVHVDVDKTTCLKCPNESMTRVDITNLKCKKADCVQIFQSLDDVAKHLVEVHGHEIDLTKSLGLVPIRLEIDRFACVNCSKSFSTLHQLSRHAGTHFLRNICYKCGGNFETMKGLKKHVLFTHSSHKHICQICKTPFPDLNAKKAHLRSSKECRSFKCGQCKERFLSQESQQEHLFKVHGKEKITYPCPECGEVFEKRISRYIHFKKIHTDDFKCTYCELKFAVNRCLQDHIARVHTLERRYRCDVCDKSFTDARTLNVHSLTHDESKKHACSACKRSFTIKTRLKHHIQKYHPEIFSTVFPTTTL